MTHPIPRAAFELYRFAATAEQNRSNLEGVWLECRDQLWSAMATNGHMIGIIEWADYDMEEPRTVKPLFVPANVARTIRDWSCLKPALDLHEETAELVGDDGVSILVPRDSGDRGQPDWRAIVGAFKGSEEMRTIGVDLRYLDCVRELFRAVHATTAVAISFNGNTGPMLIEPSNSNRGPVVEEPRIRVMLMPVLNYSDPAEETIGP